MELGDQAHRQLSVKDAAWLVRRNDETVRTWLRPKGSPLRGTPIEWSELAAYCRAHGRPAPLHPGWLDLPFDAPPPSAGLPQPLPPEGKFGESEQSDTPSREIHRLEQQVALLSELLISAKRKAAVEAAKLAEAVTAATAQEAAEAEIWAAAVNARGVPPSPPTR